jgi:Xaa-Pro aminopeptidase
MMTRRMDAFRTRLEQESLDGFLVLHSHNRNYLSGFSGSSGALLFGPSKTLFLTDSRYTLQAKSEVHGAEIVLQTRALLADAVELIKAQKVKKLGFETVHVPHAAFEYLRSKLPKVKLVPTKDLAEGLRAIKDPGEMVKMRHAGRITDQTFHHILGFIKPGVKESDLAVEMEHYMRLQGASGPSFETIVASGWRAALPHGIASDKKVAKGDMIVFDFGCLYDGYCSDMTRMVCVGKPSAEQKKIYGIVKKAQQAGLDLIRAGRKAGDVDAVSRGIIRKAGFARNFGHSLGHGVGVEVHEEPRLGPKNTETLKVGMAVTCEPGIYLEGRFGVRIEDLVLVTENGCENLYRSSKELAVV